MVLSDAREAQETMAFGGPVLTEAFLLRSGGRTDMCLNRKTCLTPERPHSAVSWPRVFFIQLVFMERLIRPVCIQLCGVHGATSNTLPLFIRTKACEVGQVLISPAFYKGKVITEGMEVGSRPAQDYTARCCRAY